jgi:hypothetical protein
MPKKRLTMRQIRELLRLKYAETELSDQAIAQQLGVAPTTIQDYLAPIKAAGLTRPLPDELCDAALDQPIGGASSSGAEAPGRSQMTKWLDSGEGR